MRTASAWVAVAAVTLVVSAPVHAAAETQSPPGPATSASQPLGHQHLGAQPQAAGEPDRGRAARTVTLVTGDRVTMFGDHRTSVTAGPGRRGMTFVTSTRNGHVSVLPADAVNLVRSGRVDARLFDVTTLLEQGLDRQRALPLIVTSTRGATQRAARRAVVAQGAVAGPRLAAVNGVAVRTQRTKATKLWNGLTGPTAGRETRPTRLRAGVAKIWLDGVRHLSLDKSRAQIGAPQAWGAGYDGAGVTVAVLDTGVDAKHPDLAGQVSVARDFAGAGPGDKNGHGTHVASIVAGTGEASGGRFRGVAPGAKIAAGTVCDADGWCLDSAILAGMHWAAAEVKAPVVNLSLGGNDTPGLDPLEQAVNTLSAEHGTLFVIAAGNSGPDGATVGSPGTADAALTVGAVDDSDQLADFSSRGPGADGALKPDLTAPGVDITAARASTGVIEDGASGPYLTISGTSMATPHVAGAAALLSQARPGTSGVHLKHLLTSSTTPAPDLAADAQGTGRVDVARALRQTVTAGPTSVALGTQQWPHDDDEPLVRDVTFSNTGAAAVTMTLTTSLTAPDGKPGPAGALRTADRTVTVPAGGTAVVQVSVLLPPTASAGRWTGQVTATAAGLELRTPVWTVQEPKMADLTVRQLDERGHDADPELSGYSLYSYDGAVARNFDAQAPATLRVPAGRYFVSAWQLPAPGTNGQTTFISAPGAVLDGSTTLTFDARRAGKVDIRTPESDAAQGFVSASAALRTPDTYDSASVIVGGGPLWLGNLGRDPAPQGTTFTGLVTGYWARPDTAGDLADSPYAYHGSWYRTGMFFTGLSKTLTHSLGATVHTTLGRNAFEQAELTSFADPPHRFSGPSWVVSEPVNLPARRVERFFSNDDNTGWVRHLLELTPDAWRPLGTVLQGQQTSYRAGARYKDSWNVPVHGPSAPPADQYRFELGFAPAGLLVAPTMLTDAAGHPGEQDVPDAVRTRIHRDGRLLTDYQDWWQTWVDVPPGTATYRVEQRLDRRSQARLTTGSHIVWTFRSGPVKGQEWTPLPVSFLRIQPAVDSTGHQPGGGVLRIPVRVERQGAAGTARRITVRVSYDDGRTWSAAQRLTPKDGVNAVATFRGAAVRDGYVTVRATSVDSRGNTVRQTMVRAFERG